MSISIKIILLEEIYQFIIKKKSYFVFGSLVYNYLRTRNHVCCLKCNNLLPLWRVFQLIFRFCCRTHGPHRFLLWLGDLYSFLIYFISLRRFTFTSLPFSFLFPLLSMLNEFKNLVYLILH